LLLSFIDVFPPVNEIYLICSLLFPWSQAAFLDSFAIQFTKYRSLKKNQDDFSIGKGKEGSPLCRYFKDFVVQARHVSCELHKPIILIV
jgi:hypothetical protein